MNRSRMLFFCFAVAMFSTQPKELMPLVIMHGINSESAVWHECAAYLQAQFPERYIKVLVIRDGQKNEIETSFINPFKRRNLIIQELNNDPLLQNKSIIGIAHSQGGLDLRAALQHNTAPNKPHFHTFISLGSPQAGYFGIPTDFDERLQQEIVEAQQHPTSKREKLEAFLAWLALRQLESDKNIVSKIFYSDYFQEHFSAAGYWHDPLKCEKYLRKCKFLPQLNNQVEHELAECYRKNIAALQRIVFVRSDNDEFIEPGLSAHFCYYAAGSDNEDTIESDFFALDQTRFNRLGFTKGQARFETVHCGHTEFSSDPTVVELIIKYVKESDELTQKEVSLCSQLETQQTVQPSNGLVAQLAQWLTALSAIFRNNSVS